MHKAMEHNVLGSTKPQTKTFSMGDTIFGFQKAKRNTLKDSKNNGLVHEKYSIVSPIIL